MKVLKTNFTAPLENTSIFFISIISKILYNFVPGYEKNNLEKMNFIHLLCRAERGIGGKRSSLRQQKTKTRQDYSF